MKMPELQKLAKKVLNKVPKKKEDLIEQLNDHIDDINITLEAKRNAISDIATMKKEGVKPAPKGKIYLGKDPMTGKKLYS